MQNISFKKATRNDWEQEVERTLKRTVQTLHTKTYEGIDIKPLYEPSDLSEINSNESQESNWHVSQRYVVRNVEEANSVLRHELERGVTELNLFITHEVNKVEHLEKLFQDISLTDVSLRLQFEDELFGYLLLMAYAERTKLDTSLLHGALLHDPFASLVKKGSLYNTNKTYFHILAQLIKANETKLKFVHVSTDTYHQGGANAVQELAISMATTVAYIRELMSQGMSFNDIAKQLTISVSVGANFFMEIAKLRAIRVMWSTIVSAFGGDEEVKQLDVHASTSLFTKTLFDPYVNMLRTTTESFSAIIGGVQGLSVGAFNELTGEDEFSRRIARNSQLILKEESYLGQVADPARGSYYVEALTNELAKAGWELFQQIEAKGGMLKALQTGFIQEQIKEVVDKRVKDVHTRKQKIVGTNMYVNTQEVPTEKTVVAEKSRHTSSKYQINTTDFVDSSIQLFAKDASTLEFYYIVNDDEINVGTDSISEISPHHLSATFEELRMEACKNPRPVILLVNLGTLTEHKARTDFINGFFAVGGFKIKSSPSLESVTDAIDWLKSQKGTQVVFCSTDVRYEAMVAEIIEKSRKLKWVVAGMQKEEMKTKLESAGVTEFIHIKSNCYDVLTRYMEDDKHMNLTFKDNNNE